MTEAVFMVHQNVPFCTQTPLQEAIAVGKFFIILILLILSIFFILIFFI